MASISSWLPGLSRLGIKPPQSSSASAPTTANTDSEALPQQQSGLGFIKVDCHDASCAARTVTTRGVNPVNPKSLSATAVKNAVVVGAGPAGLLAALELVQNGANVTIIEQRDAYTRPIHWNIRAELLHRFAETAPQLLPAILDRLGVIESAEIIDATITDIAPDKLEELRKANPTRTITVGPGGLKLQQKGIGIPEPDAQLADFGGRSMLSSPSVGQILTVDLENILFRELHRLSMQASTGNAATVTIMRNYRCEEKESDKKGWSAVDAFEVKETRHADGKTTFEPTGTRKALGTPDLVINCDGANSTMREANGVARTFVSPGAAYVAGSIVGGAITDKSPNGGLIRRRYAEMTDPKDGQIYGARQIVVGNSKAAKTWLLVEAPPFIKLETKEQADAYYRQQAALVLEKPEAELKVAEIAWGPNQFIMQQHISATAVKGQNVIFAGDAVGNGHFMTSGGVMTASVPHMFALEKLLANLADGMPRDVALKRYDKRTIAGTKAWLELGFKEFGRQISAGNFGEKFTEAFRQARERLGKQVNDGDVKGGEQGQRTGSDVDTSPLSGDGKWTNAQEQSKENAG